MKKIFVLFITLIMTVLSLCACSSNSLENTIFLSDFIHCNITESGEKFGFNLLYLYKGKKPTIDFVSFDNPNTDALFEKMIDDTIDSIAKKEYKGYTSVILGFYLDISSLEEGTDLQINSITLSVDGTKKSLDTTGKIIVKKVSDSNEKYYCNSVYSTNVPVVLFSQGKSIEAASFNYHTEDEVVVDKFEFSDFLAIQESYVYIDDKMVGKMNEVLPLSVGADKTIRIEIYADFGDYDSFSDYYINSLLHYTSDKDGSKILKDYIAIQAIGNFNDLSNLIDHITQ